MRIDLDVILIDPKPFVTPFRPSEFDHRAENVVVVHLKGSLVQGPAVSFFLEQIRLLVSRGVSNFVIDLLEAGYIDSRGVGGLAAAYNAIRDARGKIRYILASKELLSALSKIHLDQVFDIFEDEASALASFCKVAD
ncbi:MAG: STAS domain-containing protein [Acidobacteriota bacterium]